MQNVPILPPALARKLADAIVQRSLAAEMLAKVISREDFEHEDFVFWRGQHIEGTQKLAEFGVKLPTYSGEVHGFVEVFK